MSRTSLLLVATVMISGCSEHYVDPNFSLATYDDIQPVAERHKAYVEAVFIVFNGEPNEKLSASVKNHAVRALRSTGALTIAEEEAAEIHIKLRMENVVSAGELAGATAKGMVTGFTFGLVGTAVTDGFVMTITYSDPEHGELVKEYKHAVHTTIGVKDAPFKNVQSKSMDDAFATIIEELMLNFVHDMQEEGKLSFYRSLQGPKFSRDVGKFSPPLPHVRVQQASRLRKFAAPC